VPSAAEKNVAPRVIPADWLPRVVLLVLVCWGLANALTLFLFLVPVPLGRAALGLIYYPVYFRHDPLHFLVGCLLAATAASAVVTRIPRPDRWAVQWRRITGISSQVVLHGTWLLSSLSALLCILTVLSCCICALQWW
jgi:hypothetical protein